MELIFGEKKVVKSYDNKGAMQTVKTMMRRGEQLIIRFYTNRENYPCAWIESKKIQGFCLILNQKGLTWLHTYLQTGEMEDFGFNPNEFVTYAEDKDFQLSVLKQLIDNDEKRLQFAPLFREKSEYVSGYASYMKGKIFFRVPRTTELVDDLKERELIA